MEQTPSRVMVDFLNLKLEKEGSNLRYFENFKDRNTTVYRIGFVDKFIDGNVSISIPITKEFETYVRDFFKSYGVENTGYINTVASITVYD